MSDKTKVAMKPEEKSEASMAATLAKLFKTLALEAVRFQENPRKDPRFQYPDTVVECIDDDMKFKAAVYAALKKFRQSHPWRGTQGEMQFKFRVLNEELAEIYDIAVPQLVFVDKFPLGACCFPNSKPAVIMMEPERDGRYSVVCYLHEFAHCLNKDEKGACRWSINLFKRIFPNSYNALEHEGHLLKKKKSGKKETVSE